jgi:hypothetical protein
LCVIDTDAGAETETACVSVDADTDVFFFIGFVGPADLNGLTLI